MLEVKNLKVQIDAPNRVLEAVSGVSFTVNKGECFALVGESGCGKSMTAFSIMRLLPEGVYVSEGSIRVGGIELLELTEKQMQSVRGAKVSMIFQEPATSLNPVMTVGDQIVEAVRLHEKVSKAEARAIAIKWLDRVGIDEPEKRFSAFAHELSGGQKQRVMIAMALACKPDVVVADEPTTALDVTLQAQILDLLKRLQKEREIALLLITHDLAVVKTYADRVALMYAGLIVEEQSVADFFAAPKHPYAKQLLSAVPGKDKAGRELVHIKGIVPELSDMPAGCRYAPRCPLAKDKCTKSLPELQMIGDGVYARCFEIDKTFEEARLKLTRTIEKGEDVFTVQNLSVKYVKSKGVIAELLHGKDVFEAVADVSLTLARGTTLALVGESGSGKTTLAKAALGLLEDALVTGTVTIAGQAAYHKSKFDPKLRSAVQIVFQDPFASLDPRMTVGECIREGLSALVPDMDKAQQGRRIAQLLKQVGLPESAAGKLPHEFSGGQRQRIAIARALAVSPKVLVCDEPTSALDVSVQAQVLNLLKEIQAQTGIAILLITHNFAVVEYIADTVAVMKKGRLVECGPASEILEHPQNDYTKELLAAVPRL